jgi:hypothetical protein
MGFMISTKDHMDHHKPPYEGGLLPHWRLQCIIDAMRGGYAQQGHTAWLSIFLVWSIFDLYAYIH